MSFVFFFLVPSEYWFSLCQRSSLFADCGLSIHLHATGKLRLMQAVHDATNTMLMIYEPTREDGENYTNKKPGPYVRPGFTLTSKALAKSLAR